MCDFCKDIAFTDADFVQARFKGGDFIYKDSNGYGILIDTGDSGCLGSLQGIKFCPMCGRNLFDEKETPIEHFLKSEIERSESRMNVYAECFDGVRVDNKTRKELLERHIRFCKDALKQCSDDEKMVE